MRNLDLAQRERIMRRRARCNPSRVSTTLEDGDRLVTFTGDGQVRVRRISRWRRVRRAMTRRAGR